MKHIRAVTSSVPAKRYVNQCMLALSLLALAGCAMQPRASAPNTIEHRPGESIDDNRLRNKPMEQAPPDTPIESPQPSISRSDKRAVFIMWLDQQNRLYQIGAPLLYSNAELCPRHGRHLLGLTAKTKYSFPDEFIEVSQDVLGLDERLRVTNVFAGGSAAMAGVQEGDVLLAAGIEPIPEGPGAERAAASLIASELQAHSTLGLQLLRADQHLFIEVPLAIACAMAIDLGNTDAVNSYADGQRVMVTRGMLDFVRTDDELAYVIAREMAHNVMMRSPRPGMAAMIDSLRTISTAPVSVSLHTVIPPFTPEEDAAVDELALYMLARAGYMLTGVSDFWKRLSAAYPPEVTGSHTALHPSTRHRLAVMDRVVQTIAMKQNNGLPLVPSPSTPSTPLRIE